ncbi:protein SlyX [Agaricicola taiwanensis]|uniref:Protein SlyX homolog n=1 Tax=Agaricicola taiwanensis TaxID=591372 RepID=A0A8J3DYB4_9RHOB|nr:SlyX family protein [Agaricicola taiwanensis]GGE49488.1 protein SlyX [Agaricicola taiwanensis]
MTQDPSLTERLDRLETRVAYQDQAIEDLNQIITDQWKQLELLRRQFARLDEQVRDATAATGTSPGQEPPPPHY